MFGKKDEGEHETESMGAIAKLGKGNVKKVSAKETVEKAKGGDEKAKAKVGSFFGKDKADDSDMDDFAKTGDASYEEHEGGSPDVDAIVSILEDSNLSSTKEKAEAICAHFKKEGSESKEKAPMLGGLTSFEDMD